ncbi:hypothetical protein CIPAW_05G178100 [Carya illinoinensis]|uniref:Protein-tyrosine-phosphatase MKP1 n=1 Tax=Carya illinoinensis TaxID=32201 RepID=A0A8T1QKH8_CARIL|nr:hypothetical protein CIPAW_05G178100 [Carya illinoinensis]
MAREEDRDPVAGGGTRRPYLRSVSWTDRSPSEPNQNLNPNPRPQTNSKARSCLPPLQPLSITRRNVEEWPKAGSDDLGIWPNPPQTPGGKARTLESSNSEQPVREFQFKRDKLAFFDKECSRIADHIYLGSDAVAKNREVLRQNGITHVLNCVGFVSPEYFKSDLEYKTLWLQDSPSEDITSILYDVFDYFEDVREQGGRVLVHCCQGVSRSTSLVIAYLMWREGQSFEDAFQYVKAARGVTNPNMGFACQLLQCQKRVHAVPASPNSVIRMYRMAPHSSYDPLHLVPKMLNQSGVQGLDSRGAFIVHVPSAIYIWTGKNCNLALSNSAMKAAFQVVRYERAQGPIVSIKEGEEPSEFWDALANGQLLADDCENVVVKKEGNLSSRNDLVAAANEDEVGERKVDDYNLDFEIFHKALDGGVVPPFSVSNTRSETCLPARENGWGRLRRKFSNGIMKELVILSKPNSNSIPSNMIIDTQKEVEHPVCAIETSPPLSPSTHPCGSPDSFDCFPNTSPDRIMETSKEVEHSVSFTDPFLSTSPCDSFSCFPPISPKFSSKSPTLSPSTSDHSSSFTFSPSSSNWSDLSYLSSQQPSPSGWEPTDPLARTSPSIAERRGSNPPPRMMLPSVDELPQVPKNLIRSWSFSLPDLEDDLMKDVSCNQSEHEGDMIDKVEQVKTPVLLQWPSMNKVEVHPFCILNSRSVYILLAPDASLDSNSHVILFVWLGSGFLDEKGQSQMINTDGECDINHLHWETVGRNFLNQMCLPMDATVQIIREGKEPQEFLNHLSCLSFQKAEDSSHSS